MAIFQWNDSFSHFSTCYISVLLFLFFLRQFSALSMCCSPTVMYIRCSRNEWREQKKNMGKNCVRCFYHTHTHTFQNYMHALILHSIRYHVHTACVYVPVPHVQCMKNASFPSTPPHSSILHMCEFEWIAVCEQSSYYFFFFLLLLSFWFGRPIRSMPKHIYITHSEHSYLCERGIEREREGKKLLVVPQTFNLNGYICAAGVVVVANFFFASFYCDFTPPPYCSAFHSTPWNEHASPEYTHTENHSLVCVLSLLSAPEYYPLLYTYKMCVCVCACYVSSNVCIFSAVVAANSKYPYP